MLIIVIDEALLQEMAGVAKENEKDFNAMLHNSKDMPKVQTITDERIKT